eukprot:NODE_3784_length_852_cov_51.475862_g3761_i0.p1 GENE.NODE_3784_length_852_cov_51.475862_g3761_i0~~NODE_3784_length_852_cov_51.475862_g3761_i0.p1  ORF type:complete len:269 (-),score=40.56 NODE_3784_length_852_cov_51.475862_g3761_i0:45-737(-)
MALAPFTNGECDLLITTDAAARGYDAEVDHVIMWDAPASPVDVLHRAGRTARVDASGRVTVMFGGNVTSLVRRMQDRMEHGEPWEAMNPRPIPLNTPNPTKWRDSGRALGRQFFRQWQGQWRHFVRRNAGRASDGTSAMSHILRRRQRRHQEGFAVRAKARARASLSASARASMPQPGLNVPMPAAPAAARYEQRGDVKKRPDPVHATLHWQGRTKTGKRNDPGFMHKKL